MAKLTKDEVRHIAKLARLNLSDEEIDKFSTELTSILDYIDMLKEVDTKDVEPTEQVTGLRNSFRDDRLASDEANEETGKLLRPASRPDPDALLETSPLPITEHQIQTPSAHG
jgi:aspartyl-tRNA(Asn)/glutamyl-tRNA(Gln) amidotransferase subunit C